MITAAFMYNACLSTTSFPGFSRRENLGTRLVYRHSNLYIYKVVQYRMRENKSAGGGSAYRTPTRHRLRFFRFFCIFLVPKNSFLKHFHKITMYLIVRFLYIYIYFYTHNSHFILFCIFTLSSVFNIEPLARKIVQTLPICSLRC